MNNLEMYKYINEHELERFRGAIHTEDGKVITNPTEETLKEYGYKEFIETPYPETPEGYYRTFIYVDGEVITQEWSEPIKEEEENEENI